MVGTKIEKSWGYVSSSSQDVHPQLWLDHAKQLLANNLHRQVSTKVNILAALVKVMERLVCVMPMVIVEEVNDVLPGMLEFKEAFGIYCNHISTEACSIEQLKVTFLNQILHQKTGLPVVVLMHNHLGKFIILKSGYFSMEYIFTKLFDHTDDVKDIEIDFSFSEIKSLMSTDFDRKLLELAVSTGKSRSELENLGINILTTLEEVKTKIEELRVAEENAEEKAKDKLDKEIQFTDDLLSTNKAKFEVKRNHWPEFALRDLDDKIKVQEERRERLHDIRLQKDQLSKALLRRRVATAKHRLIKEQKLKQVGRSMVHKKQGAKRKLTESDDEFVASMFSEHAGYHGLRNTVTEFIGTVDRSKRIKLEDVRKYYNMRRTDRGEKRISTATARRRLAPRMKKSHASKYHIGRCLISVAVPPRTGDSSNENTHYARKFRSNLEQCLFSHNKFLPEIRDIASSSKILFKSKDDAHYVAPGTKEGFDRARQKKIFCPQDKEKVHGLPKYDFPDSTLYQTPGSHRILQKVPQTISEDGQDEKLSRDPNWDHHNVYIRPKVTQDSSGLTWSSEDVDLIIKEPFLTSTEGSEDCQISKKKFSLLRAVQLEIKLFLLMQNPGDEAFLEYNLARLKNFHTKVMIQLELLQNLGEQGEFGESLGKLLNLASELIRKSDEVKKVLSSFEEFAIFTELLRKSLDHIILPSVRPIRVDLVDSGPGQAPSQKDVIFCDRLLFHLLDTNYYARVSLADHDSYMNYAERTNSAFSDAMCVGTTIDCEVYNPLENLTVDEVSNLDSRTFKELSFQAQVKNSHLITQQLVQRINGAPCLGNFITGRVGLNQEDQFLGFLKPYLPSILAASDLTQVPGGHLALQLDNFSSKHSTRGLLFSEEAREKCLLVTGELCEECVVNPSKPGEKLVAVPQPEVNQESSAYLSVSQTSFKDRIVDDYLPRKNLDELFKEKKLEKEEEILSASKKFLVARKFIEKRIKHLKILELRKELRKKETEAKRSERIRKEFQDYDWEDEIERQNFKNLVVKDLKKYCSNYNLGSSGRKDDLKNRVRGHWYTARGQTHVSQTLLGLRHDGVLAERGEEVVPRLGVVIAECEEEIVELEDYTYSEDDLESLDSDSDDIVSFEQFSSSTETEDD